MLFLSLSESGMLEQDDISPSESGTACLAQQREPTHVCDSVSSPPTSFPEIPPTLVMTEISFPASIREEADKQSEREQESEGEKEQETERTPQEVGKQVEPGGTEKEVEPGGGRMEVEPAESDPKREEVMKEGGVETVSHAELDKRAEKQEEEVEQEEEQEEEVVEDVEALELEEEFQRPEDAILDDLAKRIQVEEVREKYKSINQLNPTGKYTGA